MLPFRIVASVAILSWVAPSLALERTPIRADDLESSEAWAAGATCTVSYYNICTGWYWVWRIEVLASDGYSVGCVFEPPCGDGTATLEATNLFALEGFPPSYWRPVDGTIAIHEADEHGCPTTLLSEIPFTPNDGDNITLWNLPVSGPIVLSFRRPDEGFFGLFYRWASDHPAAGPTGPQACGYCFPIDRVSHSYYHPTNDPTPCPVTPLFDGTCNAEWYGWAAAFSTPVRVETTHWSRIKGMYR